MCVVAARHVLQHSKLRISLLRNVSTVVGNLYVCKTRYSYSDGTMSAGRTAVSGRQPDFLFPPLRENSIHCHNVPSHCYNVLPHCHNVVWLQIGTKHPRHPMWQ